MPRPIVQRFNPWPTVERPGSIPGATVPVSRLCFFLLPSYFATSEVGLLCDDVSKLQRSDSDCVSMYSIPRLSPSFLSLRAIVNAQSTVTLAGEAPVGRLLRHLHTRILKFYILVVLLGKVPFLTGTSFISGSPMAGASPCDSEYKSPRIRSCTYYVSQVVPSSRLPSPRRYNIDTAMRRNKMYTRVLGIYIAHVAVFGTCNHLLRTHTALKSIPFETKLE